MHSLTQNLLELIKTDSEIGQVLFGYSDLTEKYKANNFEKVILKEFSQGNITWLFLTDFNGTLPSFVGIKPNDNAIYSWLDGGRYIVCNGLENMPYEILRFKAANFENETVSEVFAEEPEFAIALKKYESWCESNGIELDKDNIYHDENGMLFKKAFINHSLNSR